MIDMLDKVDPKANILLDIDMRIGKDHQQASYADMSLYFNSEGGVSGGSFSGDIDFCCNDLSRCYIDCADQSAPPAYEIEFVRDEVLEAKIPLALLSNESGIPGYFNATEIKVRDGLNPNIICDVDEMYSKIPWFRFQKRIYADPDKKDRITFIFSKITRERKFLSDLNDIEYIYLYRPDGTQIDLKQEGGIEPVNTISAWGFYNGYHNNFLIDPYMDETYLIKNYLEGETSEALQLGTYLLEVKDNIGGHVYEDDFILKRTTDIPTVDSNTVQCHIHDESEYPRESPLFNDRGIDLLDGDLYCDWKYPEYDFVNDIEEKIQVHPHISAYKGGSTLRYVYPASMLRIVDEYSPRYNDEIIDFVIVPKADLKTLICGDDVDPDAVVGTEDADEVKISIRTRVRSGSVRSYSAKKLIDIPAGFCN
jgi:hypothetical protein